MKNYNNKQRKQYTNLDIKFHHLEERSSRKIQKPDKYATQKHLLDGINDTSMDSVNKWFKPWCEFDEELIELYELYEILMEG